MPKRRRRKRLKGPARTIKAAMAKALLSGGLPNTKITQIPPGKPKMSELLIELATVLSGRDDLGELEKSQAEAFLCYAFCVWNATVTHGEQRERMLDLVIETFMPADAPSELKQLARKQIIEHISVAEEVRARLGIKEDRMIVDFTVSYSEEGMHVYAASFLPPPEHAERT